MRAFRGAASQSIARAATAAQILTVAALLGACAPAALERPAALAPSSPPGAFDVSGRLSVRHGGDALAASFRWRHTDDEHDELELASPLGQTLAMLSGDALEVQIQAADGRISTAGDWSALTEKELGWPLPVLGLSFWIQGTARPGATFSAEAGDDGRTTVLRQDGWTIVYEAYAQTAEGILRPSRLTLTYPDVELRIAIDRWQ